MAEHECPVLMPSKTLRAGRALSPAVNRGACACSRQKTVGLGLRKTVDLHVYKASILDRHHTTLARTHGTRSAPSEGEPAAPQRRAEEGATREKNFAASYGKACTELRNVMERKEKESEMAR